MSEHNEENPLRALLVVMSLVCIGACFFMTILMALGGEI